MVLTYNALNDFTRGYIDAIFFTDTGPDNPEFEGKGFYDFAPAALSRIIEDCAAFELANKALLDKTGAISCGSYSLEDAGHDLWLTRNGHGAGFWDRGFHDVGDDLTALAEKLGNASLVLGDDGKLYIE